MQMAAANCAKGFVRRGSVCEEDATQTTLSAASSDGEVSVHRQGLEARHCFEFGRSGALWVPSVCKFR
jgi:hypothetical protein